MEERRLSERVAVLETNQTSFADGLREIVKEVKAITLSLAEKKGAEKLVLMISGGVITAVGAFLGHVVR